MKKSIYSIFFIAMILYGCGTAEMTKIVEPTEVTETVEVAEMADVAEPTEAPDAVIFQSRTIEKNVREQIYDGMEDVPMVKEDLKQCSNLYIKVDKDDEPIKNLEDLQYFPEIKTISITIDEEATEQKILDYSYLQNLPGIEELNIQDPFLT